MPLTNLIIKHDKYLKKWVLVTGLTVVFWVILVLIYSDWVYRYCWVVDDVLYCVFDATMLLDFVHHLIWGRVLGFCFGLIVGCVLVFDL